MSWVMTEFQISLYEEVFRVGLNTTSVHLLMLNFRCDVEIKLHMSKL